MTEREILQYTLQKLEAAGAQAAHCSLLRSTKQEMNVEAGQMSLIRTVFSTNLHLMAIKEQRKGTYTINKLDLASIDKGILEVIEIAESSEPDSANGIADFQAPQKFTVGDTEPDLDGMYERLNAFLETVKERYPSIMLENVYLDFTHYNSFFMNSNGVDFTTSKGMYHFSAMFAGKEGEKSSSFNYSGFATKELDKALIEGGSLDLLLQQSCEQVNTQSFAGKFTGDVIVTPDCLGDFIGTFLDISIRDGALIAGTSVYKERIGKQIADSQLTVHSKPIADEIIDGYFLTSDGYKASNSTIIDKGVLTTFLLSLYGANKTGLDRAVNSGGCYVIEPGNSELAEIVRNVDRGILLARYSGGYPSQDGDFSGVAKNSYYIENGEIKYPITETMIAGNIAEMLLNVRDISRERISFGNAIVPWICFSGVTISGK